LPVLAAVAAISATGLVPGVGRSGVAQAVTPNLSGTYYADDNGVYYVQQNQNQVWWLGESVDKDYVNFDSRQGLLGPNHVWHRGLVSTSVFKGTLSGSTLTGDWVEVSRGSSLDTGSMTLAVDTVTDGLGTHEHLALASGTAPDFASSWLQGDQLNDQFYQYNDGHTELVDFYNRFQLSKKSLLASGADCGCGDSLGSTNNPDELRPYRDETVFYGTLEQTGVNGEDNIINAESPHANVLPDPNRASDGEYDYPAFACNANDGDLDLRMRVDSSSLTTDYLSGDGWGNSNRADEADSSPPGSDYVDVVPKLSSVGPFSPGYHLGIEGVMYAGDNVGTGGDNPNDQVCPARYQANTLMPGWADLNGNSILANGMPINGSSSPENLMVASPQPDPKVGGGQTPLAGLNGITWTAEAPPNLPTPPDPNPFPCGSDFSELIYQYPCNLNPAVAQPLTADATKGTEIRVTGALILDCGHADLDDEDTSYGSSFHNCDQGEAYSDVDDQNQEIHPFYSIDIIKCPLGYATGYCPSNNNTARANLTGAWGSNDGGTYYMRQVGNDIWWAGLTRDREPIMPADPSRVPTPIPNPTNVFHGTITHNADGTATITGNAILVPKGQYTGGDPTTATFTVGADRKSMDLVSSSSSTFPWPSHFDKLYEPPGTQAPTSTLSIGDPHYAVSLPFPARQLNYVTSATPLTLSATGGSKGVQNLWYRIYPVGSTPPDYTPVVGDNAVLHATGNDGLYDVETYATDNSGNDEDSHTTRVYLDNTGPTITITTPANGTSYTVGQSLSAAYGCTDAGSGVATCTGPVPSGASLTTTSPGSYSFTVNATDNLANASSQKNSYTVSYRICLLYDATKALGTPNSTVSVRLRLCNAAGGNLSSPAIVVTAVNVDGTGPPTASGTANIGNIFRYDPTIAGYIYNLQTKGIASGNHLLNFVVQGDPNGHSAAFVLK
jgi:hypothetical protein